MRFDGNNLEEVVKAHKRWLETGGENDEDRADFSDCDLSGSLIAGCNLYGANFRGANLHHCDFYSTNLSRADLTGANMFRANTYCADLRGVIGAPFIPQRIPDTGSFIAWKRAKLIYEGTHYDYSVIVKLMIPEDAKRLSLPEGECRASKAVVLEIQDVEGNVLPINEAISIKDGKTIYRVGETVEAPNFSEELYNKWVPGIYFFLDRREAVEYLTLGADKDGNLEPINPEELDNPKAYTPPNVLDDPRFGEPLEAKVRGQK